LGLFYFSSSALKKSMNRFLNFNSLIIKAISIPDAENSNAEISQLPIYGVPNEIGRQYRIDLGKDKPATLWETADYLILNNVEQHPLVQALGFTELAQRAGVCDTLLAKLTVGKKNLGIVQASNKIDGTPINPSEILQKLEEIYP